MQVRTSISLIIILLIGSIMNHANAQIRISGFVKDAESKEMLIGVNIQRINSTQGTISDFHGRFSMVMAKPDSIRLSFIGYRDVILHIQRDSSYQINMIPETEVLEEVRVRALNTSNSSNIVSLSSKEMMLMPSISAKPDVLKSLQNLPGITSQNEGSSLLIVRGGDPGQNLYLIDDIPLIYVNHLGGFMSVFNPDMINHVNVYKGGFPSRYGGRVSSIVDIAQKEGTAKSVRGNFSIGLTDASFTVEGPTKVKNSTFIINGRKTMTEALMLTASQISQGGLALVWYGFHDINAKWSWRPNDKNSFHLNLYQGDDYLGFRVKEKSSSSTSVGSNKTIWGNWMTSARWNHQFNNKLFFTQSLSYSHYRLQNQLDYTFRESGEQIDFYSLTRSSVQDYSYRAQLKYDIASNWTINGGFQSSLLNHNPNTGIVQNQKFIDEKIQSTENALFVENDVKFRNYSSVQLGMRAVHYQNRNFSDVAWEPRINLNFGFNENHRLQASYMVVNQFAHLLFTGGSIWNNEVWVPADESISAARNIQYSFGWSGDFMKGMWSTELSTYYKNLSGLAAYREGITNIVGDANWRTKVAVDGNGEAYGLEFLLKKNVGKWQGFASYTYSRAFRRFDIIDNGNRYAFEFDRPHVASVNVSRMLSPKWDFSLLWIYQTGLPYTPLIGIEAGPGLNSNSPFERFPEDMLIYGNRNSKRMSDYHRMDVAFHYKKITKRGRDAVWTFSVYNLYARQNAFLYFYGTQPKWEHPWGYDGFNLNDVKLYQLSFFPLIPSIAYRVYFDGSRFGKESFQDKLNKSGKKVKNWLFFEN